jgi:hypothetical protein
LRRGWRHAGTTPLIGLWWSFWLVSTIIGQVSFRMSMSARQPTFGELQGLTIADMISSVAGLLAGLFVILLVRAITTRQDEKFARRQRRWEEEE